MDAEMLRNVLTMLGTVLGAILVLMLVAKITSMVHVEADDARAPIDSMEALSLIQISEPTRPY